MRKDALLACMVVSLLAVSATYAADAVVPANISQQAQDKLASMRSGRIPSVPGGDNPEFMGRMRKALGNMFLRMSREVDPDFTLTEQEFAGVKAYWVNTEAPSEPGPVIIYLHGGGHVLGAATTNLGNALRVQQASQVPLLTVEYRLAPEHPFPADVEDNLAVYKALLDAGYKANDIGVYGDSAGGSLTLALALAARDAGLPMPGALAVLSPSIDHTRQGDTRITLQDVDPVIRTDPAMQSARYVGDADPRNPLVSPVFADLSGFPPLLIQVGTRELLMSDSFRLARNARAANVDVTLDVWEGMWHGWHDTPELPEAEQACAEVAAFMRSHLQFD